jgi:hypothetical protein
VTVHQGCDNLLNALHRDTLLLVNGQGVVRRLNFDEGAQSASSEMHARFVFEGTGINANVRYEPTKAGWLVLDHLSIPQLRSPAHTRL